MRETRMYERFQIESLLQDRGSQRERGIGLYLMPDEVYALRIFEEAVGPAMRENELKIDPLAVVFDSDSNLADVTRELQRAEVVVAEMSVSNAALYYALGLAHGLRRCPLLVTQEPFSLPFNLGALRWVQYADTREGVLELREHLSRAIRVFLAASRTSGNEGASGST
jgi:hypothetical protein